MKLTTSVWFTVLAGAGTLAPLSILCADDTNAPTATATATSTNAPAPDTRRELQVLYDKAPFGKWLDDHRIVIWGHVDQGVTGNFDDPRDRLNFGRLFDDRANDYRLNQVLLTVERTLAPEPNKLDWGFRFQFMYGSDARFIHSLGLLDNVSHNDYQPDIVEAYANLHFPVLTSGGVDVKLGKFVTLMGAEVIDAEGNPFYSHSYIFNFGTPLNHTGLMLTTHVTDQLDLCLGLVRGINTSLQDNNDTPAFHGGINWKTKDGKVNLFGTVHVGPEDPAHNAKATKGLDPNSDLRIIGDIVATIKPTDKLTFISDLNYGEDEGFHAEWYGVAQYVTYQLNNWLSLGARGELFRDDDGFAVVKFADNDDPINAQRGEPLNPKSVGGGDNTYTALTLGLNITPLKTLVFRPEVRWDWAGGGKTLANGGSAPFNDSHKTSQFTLAMDVIIKF